jgi:phosphoenolpyruvate---glycerone phosphotransferase subunit DhaK
MKMMMKMKKLINDPLRVADELVQGFAALNASSVRQLPGLNVLVRRAMPINGRVGVVIGGGSGHEPLFLGFIGQGLGDAVVQGAIFTSPGPDPILQAVRAVNGGAGVVLVYGNYAGDNMNFDLAAGRAAAEGITVETVRVWDDIASAPRGREDERRGTAADVFVIKTAGAAAERGWSLDEVCRVTAKARDNCRSLGVALSSCTLPATGTPIFSLGDDEMMIGMGLHGEPGVESSTLRTADETCAMMLDRILPDLPFAAGNDVNLLVNGYGATTVMELLIVGRAAARLLGERGITIHAGLAGSFCTSQEMAGCSLTLMRLDDELRSLWDDPASSPGYSQRPAGQRG